MEFERPNRSNWKKSHKLVGIGLILTGLILALFAYVLK
jgi:preprotein translocase subunit Sss1